MPLCCRAGWAPWVPVPSARPVPALPGSGSSSLVLGQLGRAAGTGLGILQVFALNQSKICHPSVLLLRSVVQTASGTCAVIRHTAVCVSLCVVIPLERAQHTGSCVCVGVSHLQMQHPRGEGALGGNVLFSAGSGNGALVCVTERDGL